VVDTKNVLVTRLNVNNAFAIHLDVDMLRMILYIFLTSLTKPVYEFASASDTSSSFISLVGASGRGLYCTSSPEPENRHHDLFSLT